jgi:hypothetical protein
VRAACSVHPLLNTCANSSNGTVPPMSEASGVQLRLANHAWPARPDC